MIRGLPADTGRLLKSRSSSIRWLVMRRSPVCGWQCGLPTGASGGCLSWRGEDARSGASGRWRDRSTTPPSGATQRIKALQALLSGHIAAHLGDAWLHHAEGTQHSEQPVLDVHNKPGRHRPQRTERWVGVRLSTGLHVVGRADYGLTCQVADRILCIGALGVNVRICRRQLERGRSRAWACL
jgi:hypothetical protein